MPSYFSFIYHAVNYVRPANKPLRQIKLVSAFFKNGEWIDLYKIQNDKYNALKKQHLDILPFISHFTEEEIAGKFIGKYSKDTIHTNKGEIYSLLECHSKTELSDLMQSLNI